MDKPSEKSQPVSNHNSYSARLQKLRLAGDKFLLVFDQWDGPPMPDPTSVFVKRVKEATGATGVLIFEGYVEIDDGNGC